MTPAAGYVLLFTEARGESGRSRKLASSPVRPFARWPWRGKNVAVGLSVGGEGRHRERSARPGAAHGVGDQGEAGHRRPRQLEPPGAARGRQDLLPAHPRRRRPRDRNHAHRPRREGLEGPLRRRRHRLLGHRARGPHLRQDRLRRTSGGVGTTDLGPSWPYSPNRVERLSGNSGYASFWTPTSAQNGPRSTNSPPWVSSDTHAPKPSSDFPDSL